MIEPILRTTRLVLRPLAITDAPRVQQLAGAAQIADMTLNIAYPYPDGAAEQWIGAHLLAGPDSNQYTWAIATASDDCLCGVVGLTVDLAHQHAEMGYWIGVPFWNRGYMTEAARAVLRFAFTGLGLHRVLARHFTRNTASGRVMQKVGMTYEGVQREHIRKGDRFEDMQCYGILRDEWTVNQRGALP